MEAINTDKYKTYHVQCSKSFSFTLNGSPVYTTEVKDVIASSQSEAVVLYCKSNNIEINEDSIKDIKVISDIEYELYKVKEDIKGYESLYSELNYKVDSALADVHHSCDRGKQPGKGFTLAITLASVSIALNAITWILYFVS